MADSSVELAHVLDRLRGAIMRDLKVAIPGTVTRYDATKQVVDVQPDVSDWFPGEGGDTDAAQVYLPVVASVPVIFPGAGGFRITFPIQVGDTVELLVNDRSLDSWLDQGGKQAPDDLRRHHLTDAVAIPGLHDGKHAWTGASTSDMTLGKDGGPQVVITSSLVKLGDSSASESAVLGDRLQTYLDALVSALTTFTTGLNSGTLTAQASACVTALGTALTALKVYKSNAVKVKP